MGQNRIVAKAVFHQREMNRTEAKYSAYLKQRIDVGEIRWALFEPIKIRLADNTFYTPDFLIVANDGCFEAHEVKTYWKSAERSGWQEDARVKIKVAAETLPIRFLAVTQMPDGSWEFEEFRKEQEQPQENAELMERVKTMHQRFQTGIQCEEIGRQATLWNALMEFYLHHRGI
jgi:hypothetical protein